MTLPTCSGSGWEITRVMVINDKGKTPAGAIRQSSISCLVQHLLDKAVVNLFHYQLQLFSSIGSGLANEHHPLLKRQ